MDFIDSEIAKDDEISLADLKSKVEEQGLMASIGSVHHWKQELGWTSTSTKYCQMIWKANVGKHLARAKENVHDINLDDRIFTEGTMVQLEYHRRISLTKRDENPGTCRIQNTQPKFMFGQELAFEEGQEYASSKEE